MMLNRISRVVSFLFHPVLMPTWLLIVLLNHPVLMTMPLPFSFKAVIAGIVFLTTVFFPLVLTWLLTRLGLVSSLYLAEKDERVYPSMAMSGCYYLTYYLLRGIHISSVFSYFMLGAALLAILTLIVNFFLKVSLHMTGIGSVTGLFLGLALHFGIDLVPEIVITIVLAGLIGMARLKCESHRPAEIYTGYAMGVAVMSVLLILI